jgi:hypothetical protein
MKIVAGIATYGNRREYLLETIRSLGPQTDEIWVYDNNQRFNLTDRGKFIGLKSTKEPVYYFSCDDDLIYPEDYIKSTIEQIKLFQCIVCYHGRKLRGKNLNYYKEHYGYPFNKDLSKHQVIDVAGTGVCAFRTDYFNPLSILDSPLQRMSDVVFSLEAAKEKKRIMVLAHKGDWIVQQNVPAAETIMHNEKDRCEVQGEIANEIFELNKHISSF